MGGKLSRATNCLMEVAVETLIYFESAGQLQVVHEKVQTQKEHYLNYRKFILDDKSDIFAPGGSKASKSAARAGRTSLANVGPPPFGSTFAQKSTMASIFAALQATQASNNAQPQVGGSGRLSLCLSTRLFPILEKFFPSPSYYLAFPLFPCVLSFLIFLLVLPLLLLYPLFYVSPPPPCFCSDFSCSIF